MEMTDQVSRKRMISSDDSFITALEAMAEHLRRSEFEIFESAESLLGFNNDDAKRLRSIRKDVESLRDAITNQTAILREKMMKKENKPLEKKKEENKPLEKEEEENKPLEKKKKKLDIDFDKLFKRRELLKIPDIDIVKPLPGIAAPLPPGLPYPVARGPPTLTGLLAPATTGLASLSERGSIGLVLGPVAPVAPAPNSNLEMKDQVSRKRMMSSDDYFFITSLEAMDEHLRRSVFEMFESAESLLGFNNDDVKLLRSIRKDTESMWDAISNQTAILREMMMMKENKPLEKRKISDIQIDEILKCSEHELFERVKHLLGTAPVARCPPTLTGLVPPATTGLASLSEQQ